MAITYYKCPDGIHKGHGNSMYCKIHKIPCLNVRRGHGLPDKTCPRMRKKSNEYKGE